MSDRVRETKETQEERIGLSRALLLILDIGVHWMQTSPPVGPSGRSKEAPDLRKYEGEAIRFLLNGKVPDQFTAPLINIYFCSIPHPAPKYSIQIGSRADAPSKSSFLSALPQERSQNSERRRVFNTLGLFLHWHGIVWPFLPGFP